MLTQKQTSTALFTLCLGTFLALLGCSVVTSFIIAFVIGVILLGISYLKKSLISATTVIDSDSNCSVTVKRSEQKSVIPELSFLGKAHVTPTKNAPSGVTPNVQDVKQVLNFTKSANSTMTTPVKKLNNSVIKLKNSHYGAGAWPLNSTPIEKKSVLVEQNYGHMMKAINNVQQASPYSVKRSAVEKECSPPVVSQHKKPKTLPLLKEGRALRHVPTVYVVHKKAENILKTKGNKRVLENTENVNDSKRRNKEEGEMDKPQKRKLLSIVHITGKKHKVPSINSPTKYSRNTDLVVTNADLQEDRRRNEERVRKLLAHKDDETTKPSIKPAKETTVSDDNVNLTSTNKSDASKTISLQPLDKENTAPPTQATSINSAPTTDLAPSAETPKSLPKTSTLDSSLVSTESKVVKSLFGSSSTSDSDASKPSFTFGTSAIKSEPPAVAQLSTNPAEAKPVLSFGLTTADPKASSGLTSKPDEPSKTALSFSFGGLTSSAPSTSDKDSGKPTFSLGGVSASTTSATPSFSFGGLNSTNASSAPTVSTQSSAAPSFSFGGSTTASVPNSSSTSNASETKSSFSFGAGPLASSTSTSAAETKPSFSFGPAASTSASAPSTGFSFGSKTSSTVPAIGSTAPSTNVSTSALSTEFSFGSSSTASAPTFGATSTSNSSGTEDAAANKGFSFGSSAPPSTIGTTAPVFGASSMSTSAPSTGFSFGSAASTTSSTGFGFGSSAATTNPTSASGTTSLFGDSSSTTTTPGFSFGSSAPATTSAPPPGFSFGSTTNTPTFGASPSTTASSTGFSFGPSTGTTSSAPTFGSSTTTTSSAGFSFGSSTSSTAQTFGGASSSTNPGSVFGSASTTSTFGSSTASAFGATTTAPSFGTTTAALGSGSVFGSGSTSNTNGAFGTSTSSGTPGFSFGGKTDGGVTLGGSPAPAPAPAPAPVPAPSTGFSFGSTAAPKSEGFNFGGGGAAPATGGFNFGGGGAAPVPATGGFNFGGTPSAPAADSPAPSNLFSSPNTATAGRRIATPRRRKPR